MSQDALHRTEHAIEVAAGVPDVYAVVADATRWPDRFGPTVHVEREPLGTGPDGAAERLRIWALGDGRVRTWVSRRTLDPDRATVTFWQEEPAFPLHSMRGRWTVAGLPDGRVRLTLAHEFRAVDDDPGHVATISRAVDANSVNELRNVRRLAQCRDELAAYEIAFADSLHVAGRVEDVYAFLRDAGDWPDRLPHVARLDLVEEAGLQMIQTMQTMSMWTTSDDGSEHRTDSLRVCLPPGRIVYKQTRPPSLLDSHTGEWSVRPDGSGARVRSAHSIRLATGAVADGPCDDLDSLRAMVRDRIGRNSMQTLHCARRWAERAAAAPGASGGPLTPR